MLLQATRHQDELGPDVPDLADDNRTELRLSECLLLGSWKQFRCSMTLARPLEQVTPTAIALEYRHVLYDIDF